MDRKFKSQLFTIVSLVGLVLILTVYWLLKMQHQYVDYENNKHKISLRYPKGWDYVENKDGAVVVFYSPSENALDRLQESINIVVQDLSLNPMSLGEYTEVAISQMQAVFRENFEVLESKPAMLAGETAHRLIFVGKGKDLELKYFIVWTVVGTKAYQITYTSLSPQYSKYVEKMKYAVKTFKLL